MLDASSEWCSPIVLVLKPNRAIRFCHDFLQLNTIAKFDAYPTPHIDDLIKRLGMA